MPSARRPSLRAHLKPRHKLWLNWDGAFLMGPRYLRFLDAVDRTGTIRAAGQAAGGSNHPSPHPLPPDDSVVPGNARTNPPGGAPRGSTPLTPRAPRLPTG